MVDVGIRLKNLCALCGLFLNCCVRKITEQLGILGGMKRFYWLACILLLLKACAPTAETAVPTHPTLAPETAVLPTNTAPPPIIEETAQEDLATAVPPTIEPTAAPPEPTATVVAEAGVVSGRTEEGAFFLGDPNAPITHIDYSDFL